MTKRIKTAVVAAALGSLMALCAASGVQPAGTDHAGPSSGPDHPECYNTAKLNDPNDFCYRTMGPWNSTRSSDEEVRALMPIERMLAAGKTTEEIRRYHPEYSPPAR
ncbi:hypothetical protein SAMN04487916_107119 [Arthrobacter sp. ov407]|uniref:hypothetical protein n=1 Tax=Arthrobacter sp. ov407 TaxID=1761748 RepID=UPI000891450C|nr:hypothetical protein [Arthrobacter sp. ov407]SDL26869.1 hypothetical protein SAMN04487916_107119 [Arthrobacter sp. ov407]